MLSLPVPPPLRKRAVQDSPNNVAFKRTVSLLIPLTFRRSAHGRTQGGVNGFERPSPLQNEVTITLKVLLFIDYILHSYFTTYISYFVPILLFVKIKNKFTTYARIRILGIGNSNNEHGLSVKPQKPRDNRRIYESCMQGLNHTIV